MRDFEDLNRSTDTPPKKTTISFNYASQFVINFSMMFARLPHFLTHTSPLKA